MMTKNFYTYAFISSVSIFALWIIYVFININTYRSTLGGFEILMLGIISLLLGVMAYRKRVQQI